ncbi:SWF/SNF family helicase [Candidatus Magnetobacterium bavaricum]|uniref:SWF/SNF family helicase n=1 Tax=Candidatus Magnetobacterium bavaricum TaxID=29290 RepID=A0A0F3GRV2_9BACT|nr:SWF/SNF family helicase [Candidatus Magnetobacterium bavaricum]
MAKRATFGNTWWGKAWVTAMEKIDYNTNRLPRGRRYANNGSVREIKISEGNVKAKVKGSRPSPYKIDIELPKFTEKQIKEIEGIIHDNPALCSMLSIGQLPEGILSLLDSHKIHLFPSSWNDVQSNCSCPDWANPCKHLAAVYYIIANEIDKNPFIVFNLRGMPTERLISAAGIHDEQTHDHWDRYKERFVPFASTDMKDHYCSISEIPELTFKSLDIGLMFLLLQDNPLFYKDGNLKEILNGIYKTVVSKVDTYFLIEDEDEYVMRNNDIYLSYNSNDVLQAFITPPDNLPSEFNNNTTIQKVPSVDEKKFSINYKEHNGCTIPFDKLVGYLANHPDPSECSASLKFLKYTVALSMALIRAAAFVPEIFAYSKDEFIVRYVPLINDEYIRVAIDYQAHLMPINVAYFQKEKTLLTRQGAYDILCWTITTLIHSLLAEGHRYTLDNLLDTFTKGGIFKVTTFQQSNTAKSITDWLENLSIRKKDISPLIRIEFKEDDEFEVNVDIHNKALPSSPIIPLSQIFGKQKQLYSQPINVVRTDILKQLVIASMHMPELKGILESKGLRPSIVTLQDMANIIGKVRTVFDILGINIVIPKGLRDLAKPRLSLKASVKSGSTAVSYISLNEIINYQWELSIGDTKISQKEFLRLVKTSKGIVKYKDEYLMLDPEEVKAIMEKLNSPIPTMSSMQTLHSVLTGEINGTLFDVDDTIKRIIEDLTKPSDISLPSGLNASLRPYQLTGFRWLYTNAVRRLGSCLADDMGLGKTIQVITLILKLKEEKRLSLPVVIICPTTLIGNWLKEFNRFAPTLNIGIYYGTERALSVKDKDAVITTYGIVRRDIKKFSNKTWSCVVIDEAQNIKNNSAAQTKAIKTLKPDICIAMSGTPVENRLTELWSIMDFTNKGYLGSMEQFKKTYADPIERYRNSRQIEKLRLSTAPFVLRRLKSDKSIIKDLPDKVVFDEYCYLTKEQAAIYQRVVDNAIKTIEETEGINRKGLIFKLITSLKQICNHPAHYSKGGSNNSILSGKSEKTIDLLKKIRDLKEKVLIFTQYNEMGKLLQSMILEEMKLETLFFHGTLSRTKRDLMVDEFQLGGKYGIMIVSLKAGGTGLNLTSATNVIHYDLWWNPAVEAQATDRTYRIGQDKNVIVHRLITLGTFEEKIDDMIKAKKELSDLTVVTGEKWITELSNRELKELFSPPKPV